MQSFLSCIDIQSHDDSFMVHIDIFFFLPIASAFRLQHSGVKDFYPQARVCSIKSKEQSPLFSSLPRPSQAAARSAAARVVSMSSSLWAVERYHLPSGKTRTPSSRRARAKLL